MTATHIAFSAFEILVDESSGSFTDGQIGLSGTTRVAITAADDEARAFGVNADGTGWTATLAVADAVATWTFTPSQGTSTEATLSQFLEDLRAYINA